MAANAWWVVRPGDGQKPTRGQLGECGTRWGSSHDAATVLWPASCGRVPRSPDSTIAFGGTSTRPPRGHHGARWESPCVVAQSGVGTELWRARAAVRRAWRGMRRRAVVASWRRGVVASWRPASWRRGVGAAWRRACVARRRARAIWRSRGREDGCVGEHPRLLARETLLEGDEPRTELTGGTSNVEPADVMNSPPPLLEGPAAHRAQVDRTTAGSSPIGRACSTTHRNRVGKSADPSSSASSDGVCQAPQDGSRLKPFAL